MFHRSDNQRSFHNQKIKSQEGRYEENEPGDSETKYPFGTKGALLYRVTPVCVRSARQTARTIEVRAVLRHFVLNQGLVSPTGSVSASKCFAF